MSNQSSAGQKAARAASAAVNIARGAAAGGVYGAAVEAAKSFLPELIRLFVILLCVVLLVPMLVFTALPNILFGYSSSTDQEIIDFTASAQELDGIYQNLDNYQQPAVLRLVNSILPRFWSDGEPLYDDYGVDQDLGYMNKYWLMAIGSVRYKQDLYTMDESAIEDMMYDRLTYSTSLIDRILNIFVRDLTPEEYMDKLNFTQEERDWAALLYSMLAEDQNLSYGDSDGDGYYNTDYGDITFSDAETPVVYYNQTDSRWGNKMYGKSGTIGEAGCGPTALAIAVASLTSNQVTPYDVAQWSVENGYRCEGNGSYHSLIPNGGAHYGLTVTGVGNDSIQLNALLPNCRFASPLWITDTITRLLDRLERRNGKLPLLEEALLMIDEHCDIAARQVYDQDNKAWKAISNALKGRVVADDDQYSLGVCLLSRRSSEAECHIYVLPVQDAGDFFFLRSDQYPFSR